MPVNKLLLGLALMALSQISIPAHAAITSPIKLTFNGLPAAVYGDSAATPLGNGGCPLMGELGDCYYEQGMAIGAVDDSDGYAEHLHKSGSTNPKLQYHADSSGIYIRAVDGSAFSLNQMQFRAAFNGENNSGYNEIDNPLIAGDFWEILGFNTAINPDLGTGDGTHYASRVAYQEVANGFYATLILNPDFHNIHAFWIHFKGYPGIPSGGVNFGMTLDDVQISAPVPLPSAVWMFSAGLLGVVSAARKKL